LAADFWSLAEATSLTVAVVPLADILAVGDVVEAEVLDKESMRAASVLP